MGERRRRSLPDRISHRMYILSLLSFPFLSLSLFHFRRAIAVSIKRLSLTHPHFPPPSFLEADYRRRAQTHTQSRIISFHPSLFGFLEWKEGSPDAELYSFPFHYQTGAIFAYLQYTKFECRFDCPQQTLLLLPFPSHLTFPPLSTHTATRVPHRSNSDMISRHFSQESTCPLARFSDG